MRWMHARGFRLLARLTPMAALEKPRHGAVTAALVSGARFGGIVGLVIAAIYAMFIVAVSGYAVFLEARPTVEALEIGVLHVVGGFVVVPLLGAATGGIVSGGLAAAGLVLARLEHRVRGQPDDSDSEPFP